MGTIQSLLQGASVRIVIYKPLLKHQSRELKRTDGYGANFHNCAFTGFSWCGIVNSDTSPDGGHYRRLPAPCRSTAIVLSLPLTVEELASLTHGGSYRGYRPIEAYNRHCNFPIALPGLQGLPPLTLHSDDGKEVPLNEERKIDKSSQQLSQNEQDILMAAARSLRRSAKTSLIELETNMALQIAITACCLTLALQF
eukprot:s2196_g5.t1